MEIHKLLYDASLQVVANSHSLAESIFVIEEDFALFFEAKWKPLYF
jgi:hypothetical protein